jgi:hypothetical protein
MAQDRPTLESGTTRAVVIRNISRLVRAGFSWREAGALALAKAGLTRFPPGQSHGTAAPPTVH